jgi:hypothetical protein
MHGCEPPTKISLVTGKEAYAFAKTDQDFLDLEEHENPAVQALVAARLGHKSTIAETRTERLLAISRLSWPNVPHTSKPPPALMPVPLRYAGAHTHRLSGDWKLNLQNLPKYERSPEGKLVPAPLRRALIAKKGKSVIAVDASQIEARLVAWFCQQEDLLKQFAAGEDVYANFATQLYGYPVGKQVPGTERERFIGKTVILGAGYGMGWVKFQRTVRIASGGQIDLDDIAALDVVKAYRATYPMIPTMWNKLAMIIESTLYGGAPEKIHPVSFEQQEIVLPSQLRLFYCNLRRESDQWVFEYGGRTKRLYGGALLENIIQALARIHVMDAALRLRRRGLQLALQAHDELVYVVPDNDVGPTKQILLEEMRRCPTWATNLPLDAEVKCGPNYGDLKVI